VPGSGGLFSNDAFLRLWAAATLTNFGSMVTRIALPFLAITVLDASPVELAALTAAGLLPGIALGLFAASYVDRLRRRPLLVASDWGRAALYASIPAAHALGFLSIPYLLAVYAAAGFLRFLFDVAHRSYLPSLVAESELVAANSRLQAAEAVTEGAAFGIGGWLVALLTAPIALLVDTASFVLSALLISNIRRSEPPPPDVDGRRRLFAESVAGVRAVLGHRLLRPLVVSAALRSGSFQMMAVLFMLFAIEELGFGIAAIGMIAAVGAGSSFVAAVLVGRVTRTLQPGYTMILGGVVLAASTLLIPLVPSAGFLGVAMLVAHQLGDGGDVLYEVNAVSLRQAITPNALLGRVNGGFEFAESSAMLLGTALGGALGEVLGLRPTLFVAAGIAFLSPLVLLASPVQSVHLGDPTPDVPSASGA